MDPTALMVLMIVGLLVFGGASGAVGDFVVAAKPDDVTLLARLIDVEARGEPYHGKVAVGAVVVNRVKDPRFPNTIREVIYEPGQFHVVGLPRRPVPSQDAVRAAEAALQGQDPTGGALFFYNPDLAVTTPWWAARPNKLRIGDHVFSH